MWIHKHYESSTGRKSEATRISRYKQAPINQRPTKDFYEGKNMPMTFFGVPLENQPIVIKDILDRELFVVPIRFLAHCNLECLGTVLEEAGLLSNGANAFQGEEFIGTTEW